MESSLLPLGRDIYATASRIEHVDASGGVAVVRWNGRACNVRLPGGDPDETKVRFDSSCFRRNIRCAGRTYTGLARSDIHYAYFSRSRPWDWD